MPERGQPAEPVDGREPTSHERRSGEPWDASYRDGTAPWDIGRPQPAIARLVAEGRFAGAVLDAGCGSGENALHVASSLGVSVFGVDLAETAVALAREKAAERGIDAEFAIADALDLGRLGRSFGTVLDCGLFHTLDAGERLRYVASLATATAPGGTAFVLCFSDQGPDIGPHPVSVDELRAAFTPEAGWGVAAIAPERIETMIHDGGVAAWLATVERV